MTQPSAEVAIALSKESVALNRQASDVAGLCRDIVMKTALDIGGRKHVRVEGWTSIATTYGCIATITAVERVEPRPGMAGGIRAVAELHRMSDGAVLSRAEGFVGEDEPTWYGGRMTRWNKFKKVEEEVVLPKRPDYAIRAMAQTRAISRVCRGPFSHVVVLIDAGLSTTPAEEVMGPDDDVPMDPPQAGQQGAAKTEPPAKPVEVPRDEVLKFRAQFEGGKWEPIVLHFGKNKGVTLGSLEKKSLAWYCDEWHPKAFGNKPIPQDDILLRAALDVAKVEGFPDGK